MTHDRKQTHSERRLRRFLNWLTENGLRWNGLLFLACWSIYLIVDALTEDSAWPAIAFTFPVLLLAAAVVYDGKRR